MQKLTQKQKAGRAQAVCLALINAEKTQSGADFWANIWRVSGCNHPQKRSREQARAAFFDSVLAAMSNLDREPAQAIAKAMAA